jgi:hypothetical protein
LVMRGRTLTCHRLLAMIADLPETSGGLADVTSTVFRRAPEARHKGQQLRRKLNRHP